MTKPVIWSTFAGIGGLDLGLEMAGFPPPSLVCEWEPWNRALLAQHYPDAIQHDDIRTLEASHGPRPDIITGGFPCQDISVAGAQAGLAGAKSGLWWELARVIAATRPGFVVLENVAAILSDSQPVVPPRAEWLGDAPTKPLHGAFGAVLWTLAALGYDATWDCVPAGALGAPHRRDRWFLVAYTRSGQPQRHGATGQVAGAEGARSGEGAERERLRDAAGCGGSGMAYSRSSGLEGHRTQQESGGPQHTEPPASGIWRRAIDRARAAAPWSYLPRVGGTADGVPGGMDATWPSPRHTDADKGGRGDLLSAARGHNTSHCKAGHRPVQPWEQDQPRTKPHEAHWKQRLRGLGNAVVPVAGMVPGLVVRELIATGYGYPTGRALR